jgi:DNA-binding GntR family transcriptional regulator
VVTADDVIDVFIARAGLETEAVWRLATDGVAVPAAVEAVERFEALPDDSPWSEVVELDLTFHRAFFDALSSPRMSKIFASLQSELCLVLSQHAYDYGSVPEVARQHRVVLDAFLAGDAREAANEMRRHLDEGLSDILAAVGEPEAQASSAGEHGLHD